MASDDRGLTQVGGGAENQQRETTRIAGLREGEFLTPEKETAIHNFRPSRVRRWRTYGFFAEVVYVDRAQPAGLGISNALQVEFLP